MGRVVVLGAGIAGHTSASYLRKWLDKTHEVVVVAPTPHYNWVPSNIWLDLGLMQEQQVSFPLAPVYRRAGIRFEQARAVEIHPEGDADSAAPYVVVESTSDDQAGQRSRIPYDYLVNATGPKLNFAATEGLGPGKNSVSVCTPDHATEAAKEFLALVARMKQGERCRFVVGSGHGQCTCQGAAFEYVVNLEFELRHHGVRDKAEVIFLTNEYELGDFGMNGAFIQRNGYIRPTNIFTESVLAERDIWSVTRAHVRKVEKGKVFYETLDGEEHELTFDMAMLLPPLPGWVSRPLTARARRSRRRCLRPTALCAWTPTPRRSRMNSGRPPTGRRLTRARRIPTSLRQALPLRRRIPSRGRM